MNTSLDQQCINTIRTLAIDGVQKAKSGHPGMPMGAAPTAYVLWTKFLKHNPQNPKWANRDRFVLSGGHGSMLLYSLLHLTGYDLPFEELQKFRQLGSKTPGHPEFGHTAGVETTTGPLGQGFANGVGMAIAQKYLAATFNKPNFPVVDYWIYAMCGDGDLMEGVASEAASLAGHLKLGNMIYMYDDNNISIDGSTGLSFTEDVGARFEAYGWHVQTVNDGNNLEKIETAIRHAQQVTDKPSLIKVKTHIGYGSPNKQDSHEAHGSPLGDDEIKLTKKNYGWDENKTFYIPDESVKHFRNAIEDGKKKENDWKLLFDGYKKSYPELAATFENVVNGNYGDEWKKALPIFTPENGNLATREASGKVLAAIVPHLPTLIGGSADLTPSNNTFVKGMENLNSNNFGGRYIRYGVREHAMGSLMNGIALTNGMIPYGGTFLIFSEYMRPPIRLAALMGIRPIYVFTHDSIGLGEDGPTHQPVEQFASLRAIPNITLIRPADANETALAWKIAIEQKSGPVALALTRQKLPFIDRTKYASADLTAKGAYVLTENSSVPEIILIGTGSELQYALGAYEQLVKDGIQARLVSMPSWELFERQSKEYRESVFPNSVKKRLAVEAGVELGWHKYASETVTINSFGQSAPYEALYKHFGFTTENVLARAKAILGKAS
ncbi:MAG TPA: transketolase [Bacteroidetes bacterium]|nr:transketolase [Bacteroidota bacterium]